MQDGKRETWRREKNARLASHPSFIPKDGKWGERDILLGVCYIFPLSTCFSQLLILSIRL